MVYKYIKYDNLRKGMCNVKKAAVFFGTGYEEIEALTVVDLLRRAGIEVTCVAIDGQKQVMGAHHINVDMDAAIEGLDLIFWCVRAECRERRIWKRVRH